MTPDKRQSLEQAGFTVDSVNQFLGSIQTGAAMTETTTSGIKVVDPTVRVIAKPYVDEVELRNFVVDEYGEYFDPYSEDAESRGDALSEFSGRVCYMSFKNKRPGGNKAYLDHIKEVGHGSVLEHANYSLLFTGVSRSLTHELVRHRAGMAYSMLSQRYVDESVAEYVEPDIIRDDPELHEIWLKAIQHAHEAYVNLADRLTEKLKRADVAKAMMATGTERRKAARQAARSVLPNATETKIVVTGNARAWRHFLEQRGSRHAEPEIRKLANLVLAKLQSAAPNLFSDYVMDPLDDGTSEINTKYRKV